MTTDINVRPPIQMSLYRLHDRKVSSSCRFAPVCPRRPRSTAVSTVTTCIRTKFDTLKYSSEHAQIRPCTHALAQIVLIEQHGTASHRLGAEGRGRGLSRICGPFSRCGPVRLRQPDRPARPAASRAACAVIGRRGWSPTRRISLLIRLLRRAGAQGVQM